jgi:UDP-glucose 4-epimerase
MAGSAEHHGGRRNIRHGSASSGFYGVEWSLQAAVLGGGGFLGRNLCRLLTENGHDVVAIGRSSRPSGLAEAVRWCFGDFLDSKAMASAVAGADAVFHLVGSSSPQSSNDAPGNDVAAAVVSTLNFLDHSAGSFGRLVFISSGGTVYGRPDILPIPETAPLRPGSAYAINKVTLERYLELYRQRRSLDYCVLRVSNPFGPEQIVKRQQGVVAAFIQSSLSGNPVSIWGDGKVVRDFIYVDDVSAALIKAALAPLTEERIFNVGSGRGRSLLDVADMIELVSERPLLREFFPSRVIDAPAIVLDCGRAHAALDWQPQRDWEDGIRRTYDWARMRVR